MFDTPEKPLTAGANPDNYSPNTTFFYEQPGGRIIVVEEQEAYLIHGKYKQVGVSDGLIFHKALKEAKQIHRDTGDLKKAQELLRKGEQDELETAKGHFQVPRNYSFTNNKNQPIDKQGNLVPPNRRV